MKQFLIIGCGRFGESIATTLYSLGHEVLVVDKDEEKVSNISQMVTHAVIADITNEGVLKDLGVKNFDVCVVAISSNYEASIIATVEAKELGVKKVVAKAKDELHSNVLKKIGADKVIIPERDMGIRVAHNLISSNILEYIELSEDFSMVEINLPNDWEGKSLRGINLRGKYGLNVVAIKNGIDITVNPNPDQLLKRDDVLLVVGKTKEITNLVITTEDEL